MTAIVPPLPFGLPGGGLTGVGGGAAEEDVARAGAQVDALALAALQHAEDGGAWRRGERGADVPPVLSV